MTKKMWFTSAVALALAVVCGADTIWSNERRTNDDRVTYRWRRLDFGSLSSNCEIEIYGPARASIRGTAIYRLNYDSLNRYVSGYFVDGRTSENISGCDRVVDVVVDRVVQ